MSNAEPNPANFLTMNPRAEVILGLLQQVAHERRRRGSQPGLQAAVAAVKHYQQQRFMHTYADLLGSERYGAATDFFLDELYGPRDFSQRDAQFLRVVPTLVRLFPASIVDTVETLARLHALSEQLDSEMGIHLGPRPLAAETYIDIWQTTARRRDRRLQIDLTLAVGSALDRYTRQPLLRQTLKMMRGPAKAAGLGELQRFLETGFDTFKQMSGAKDFLEIIRGREQALADALFAFPRVQARRNGSKPEATAPSALDLLPPTASPNRPFQAQK